MKERQARHDRHNDQRSDNQIEAHMAGGRVAPRPRTDPYERISRIRLLPWMDGVKAYARIWMLDADAGDPLAHQSDHAIPVDVAGLASAA